MVRQIEAIYEQGVLRPLEPLALPEQQRVRVTVEDVAAPFDSRQATQRASGANQRSEEFQWLAEHASEYAGKWVALDGNRLVAYGDDLPAVRSGARAAGVERPLFTHLPPDGELPFGGW